MDIIIYTFVITAIVCILIIALAFSIGNKKVKQLKKYWEIEIGMSEYEMLDIMGNGYNRSLLKNNRAKYEWRINASSYGSSYNGVSVRNYSGVKKVVIYTKDGYVEEVKPYNI